MRMSLLFTLCFLFSFKTWALSMPAPPGHQSGMCPMNYDPVCGADGKTYSNSCQAMNAEQQSYQPGPCGQNPGNGPDCVHCGGHPFLGTRPTPFFPQVRPRSMMPWWGYQGFQRYPNFHYPGAWQNYGMNPTPYAGGSGGGAAFAAKPNIYIEGPTGTQLQVEVKYPNNSQHLVSTPDMTKKIKAELREDGQILVGKASYDYLFYDFRFDHSESQYTSGECLEAKKLIPRMSEVLTKLGYSERSREDFKEHWSQKIPYANKYCIYPQFNRELLPVADLKVSSSAKQSVDLTRVLFIVQLVPDERDLVFPPAPQKPIQVPQESKSGVGRVLVQEWGVAFLSEGVLEFSSP